MLTQHCTNLLAFTGSESSDVVRFYLGPLLQGQMRRANLKVLISRWLLVLEVLQCETNQ